MELSTLPEDELLAVLSYLNPEELLICRGVCRRWREVAVHPTLWSRQDLSVWQSKRKSCRLVAAVLRVAPCLRRLLGFNPDHFKQEGGGALLAVTPCAIAKLYLSSTNTSASALSYAALMLCRQAALGRLKNVTVTLLKTPQKSLLRLDALVQQLFLTHGLEKVSVYLSLRGDVVPPAPAARQVVAVPSRTLRHCELRGPLVGRYLHLLAFHAATLEDVRFSVDAPRVAHLISSMPRLRELWCPVLEDMSALRQCPSLRKLWLTVDVDASRPQLLQGAATFLRSVVTRLEKLWLFFSEATDPAGALDVVRSLGGTGTGAFELRELTVDNDMKEDMQLTPVLIGILHRLPHLTDLDCREASSDALLAALDGRVVPALESLRVRPATKECCPHEWGHREIVRALVQRYPRLHIVLEWGQATCPDCAYCRANTCHSFRCDPELEQASLVCGHPAEQCDFDHYQWEDEAEIFISMHP